jgi:hypothetical protein
MSSADSDYAGRLVQVAGNPGCQDVTGHHIPLRLDGRTDLARNHVA